jgi:hypothetical protein
MTGSKGVRRLAVLLGAVGATGWLIFVAMMTKFFSDINEAILSTIIGMALVSFLVLFALVHAIAWVIRGFREDKKK